MGEHEELDNLKEFLVEESVDAKRRIPVGWLILFWGLILWGVYYFLSYTPSISGWSQVKAYEESVKK
ncbi:MAG TPA: cbb3-type cytochrome c oxidase N-terminal domain-containing protein [Thermodesulfovibrionales bacterium]|nr:cbb3-type cytochrome c oxidase N-terminal domain-containing protein [Thermodesulfovibrionales bacterium]